MESINWLFILYPEQIPLIIIGIMVIEIVKMVGDKNDNEPDNKKVLQLKR